MKKNQSNVKPLCKPLSRINSDAEEDADKTSPELINGRRKYMRPQLPKISKPSGDAIKQCFNLEVPIIENMEGLNEEQRMETFTSNFFMTVIHNPNQLQDKFVIQQKINKLIDAKPEGVDINSELETIKSFLTEQLDLIDFFCQTSQFSSLIEKYQLSSLTLSNPNFKSALKNFFQLNINMECLQLFYVYLFDKVPLSIDSVDLNDDFFEIFGGKCCYGYTLCSLIALQRE
ncbi:Hypothetical_protein [Hexamita inflata]|uniref:Hypothetical_protein n=1 Tax=Hexamita inflata TaxID=28002 RepID=A0ABP1GWV7_9EUKA